MCDVHPFSHVQNWTVLQLRERAFKLCDKLNDDHYVHLRGRSTFLKEQWVEKVQALEELFQIPSEEQFKKTSAFLWECLCPILTGLKRHEKHSLVHIFRHALPLLRLLPVSKTWHTQITCFLNRNLFPLWNQCMESLVSPHALPQLFHQNSFFVILSQWQQFRGLFGNGTGQMEIRRNAPDILGFNEMENEILQHFAQYQSDIKFIDYAAELAVIRYATLEQFESAQGSRKRKEVNASVRQRRAELCRLLRNHKLPLRNDSVLCDQYILHGKPPAEQVVTTMVEMNFFYKCTRYDTIRREMRRETVRRTRSCDPTILSQCAKKVALKEFQTLHAGDSKGWAQIPPSLTSCMNTE